MNVSDIEKVIPTLKKEVKQFQSTALTKESRRRDPFRVLISCILSLRTKDAVTAEASARLFAKASTPRGILKLRTKTIEQLIYPVAFYRVKSKNIKKVCKLLLEKYNGRVPDTIDELLTLPNVGRKTANITVTLGFNKLGVAVDTHVHRISNRFGLVKTKTPDETEFALRKLLSKKYWIEYNDLLVTWGQNICAPISPWCSRCALRETCKRVGVGRSR